MFSKAFVTTLFSTEILAFKPSSNNVSLHSSAIAIAAFVIPPPAIEVAFASTQALAS